MPTIRQRLDDYLEAKRPVVIEYRRMERASDLLVAAMGEVDAADARAIAEAVSAYIAARGLQVAPGSVARDLVVLRAALMHAWRQGSGPRIYVHVPRPGSARQLWLAQDRASELIAYFSRLAREGRGQAARRARAMELFVRLGLATGARITAILELTWDRVDMAAGTIDFRADHPRVGRRKGRAVVALSDPLALRLMRAHRAARSAQVIPLSASIVRRQLRAAGTALGIVGLSPHVMRHTVATWLLAEDGMPIQHVSRLLGHKSVAVTEQVYGHLVPEHLRSVADRLTDRLDWPREPRG